jgi:gliding motility-associated-like protein
VADAGPDQQVDIPLISLSANTPQIGIGYWEVVSGSVSIPVSSRLDPNLTLFDVPPGNYIFRWTITGTVCDSTSDEVAITVNEFVIPSGFSPNGDAINDYFVIPGVGYWSDMELHVYNRWGEEVFVSADYHNEWDGRNQSGNVLVDDTYYYVLEVPGLGSFAGFVVLKTQ